MYFVSDIKKMLTNRIVQILFIILLIVMVFDPVSVMFYAHRYPSFYENIGANPFQFWLLMNSASWGNQAYTVLFWVFPVLVTGMIYYTEQKTSMGKFLMIRKSNRAYMTSKIFSTFLFAFAFFMVLLSINLAVTFTLFSADAPITEQYQQLVPNNGTLASVLYQVSPLFMAIVYTFFNALTISIFSVFALAIQMIAKFKNQYIAIVVPVIVLYTITFIFDSVAILLPYDMRLIIQPRSANAISGLVTGQHVLLTFGVWMLIDVVLVVIGFIRNRDTL